MKLEPLSCGDVSLLTALMDEEERAWLRELDWDYAPIRRILSSFLEQRLLPGFMLTADSRATGYTYFITSRHKGVIGTLYSSPPDAQQAADRLLSRTIEAMKETPGLHRIEAQIIPLHGLNLDPIFTRHGFRGYLRHYMELDLCACALSEPDRRVPIVSWQSSHLAPAAGVAYRSYRHQIDAVICEDYGSEAACESYLRSLVEKPGCGTFMPDASFVGLNRHNEPCGFILISRLAPGSAMIPQISILPAHQGKRIGTMLIQRALVRLGSQGYKTVRLTVTDQNRRACEWYRRIGFTVRRDFSAYLWRDPSRS